MADRCFLRNGPCATSGRPLKDWCLPCWTAKSRDNMVARFAALGQPISRPATMRAHIEALEAELAAVRADAVSRQRDIDALKRDVIATVRGVRQTIRTLNMVERAQLTDEERHKLTVSVAAVQEVVTPLRLVLVQERTPMQPVDDAPQLSAREQEIARDLADFDGHELTA